MKIVADSFTGAAATLRELRDFEIRVYDMYTAAAPYSVGANGRTLPRFVVETTQELQGYLVKNFTISFPAIQALVVNGEGATENAYSRLHDALYLFNEVQRTLQQRGCVLPDDASRKEIQGKLARVIGDIVVFICVQYDLKSAIETGDTYQSVASLCEKQGITVSVFRDLLMQDLLDMGECWYAYETVSPYYQALQEFDAVLAAECEDALFPLTDEMAKKLLDGEIDVPYVRMLLNDFVKDSKEVDVEVTPATMMSKMNLEG